MQELFIWDGIAPIPDDVERVKIMEGVIRIPSFAFFDLDNLVEVQLPKTLKFICPFAFSGCPKLVQPDVSKVKDVSPDAFYSKSIKTEGSEFTPHVRFDWPENWEKSVERKRNLRHSLKEAEEINQSFIDNRPNFLPNRIWDTIFTPFKLKEEEIKRNSAFFEQYLDAYARNVEEIKKGFSTKPFTREVYEKLKLDIAVLPTLAESIYGKLKWELNEDGHYPEHLVRMKHYKKALELAERCLFEKENFRKYKNILNECYGKLIIYRENASDYIDGIILEPLYDITKDDTNIYIKEYQEIRDILRKAYDKQTIDDDYFAKCAEFDIAPIVKFMNVLKNRLDKQQSVNQQIIGVGPLTIKAILNEAKMHPMSTSVAMLVAEICNIVNLAIDTEYYIDKYFDIKDGTDTAKKPPIYHKGEDMETVQQNIQCLVQPPAEEKKSQTTVQQQNKKETPRNTSISDENIYIDDDFLCW